MSEPKKPATSKFQPLPTGKKVFDVVRPGKSPALPTSRPVITGHKPSVADDQFVPTKPSRLAGDPAERHELLDSSARFKELPASENQVQPEVTATTEDVAASADNSASRKAPRVISSAILSREVDLNATQIAGAADSVENAAPGIDEGTGVSGLDTAEQGSDHIEQDAVPEVETALQSISSAEQHNRDDEQSVGPELENRTNKKEEPAASKFLQPFTDQEFADRMSHDDVVANTSAPLFDHQQMVISHHRQRLHIWQFLLLFLLVVILAAIALNFLLDARVLTTQLDIPHTDLIR